MFTVLTSSVRGPANHSANPGSGSGFIYQNRYGGSVGLTRRRITVCRDSLSTPWGFRLQGGRDLGSPLCVQRVFSGSPADGQLTRDDLILAINDRLTNDLRHAEALELLNESGDSIDLIIDTSLDSGRVGIATVGHSFGTEFARQKSQPLLKKDVPAFTEEPVHHAFPPSVIQHPTPPPGAAVSSHQAQELTGFNSEEIERQTRRSPHHQPSYSPQPGNRFQDLPVREPGNQKVAPKFRPTTEPQSTGMGQMGWVAKPKPGTVVAARALESQRSAPPPSITAYQEPPPPPHPVALQSAFSSVDESQPLPACYGYMGHAQVPLPPPPASNAAMVQNPLLYEDAQQQQQQQQQNAMSQSYKAEIRGLRLTSRPAGQSGAADTHPEYFAGVAEQHGAPQVPVPTSMSSRSKLQSSPKIQPSMMFGTVFVSKTGQQSQSTWKGRTQPQPVAKTTRTAATKQSPLSVSQTSEPNPLTAQLCQQISPSVRDRPMQPTKVVSTAPVQPQQAPQVQYPNTRPAQPPTQNFSASQQRQGQSSSSSSSHVPAAQLQPGQGKPDKPSRGPETPVERFNPGQDKRSEPSSRHVILVERFNPGPEQPGKPSGGADSLVECFCPGLKMPGKPSGGQVTLVERFNPGSERSGKSTSGQVTLVERFNPGSERSGKPSGGQVTLVEHFNPGSERSGKSTSGQITLVERFNPGSERSGKSTSGQVTFVERFNPGSERSGKSTSGQVTLVERFNPGSERSGNSPACRIIRVERFNPGPERA